MSSCLKRPIFLGVVPGFCGPIKKLGLIDFKGAMFLRPRRSLRARAPGTAPRRPSSPWRRADERMAWRHKLRHGGRVLTQWMVTAQEACFVRVTAIALPILAFLLSLSRSFLLSFLLFCPPKPYSFFLFNTHTLCIYIYIYSPFFFHLKHYAPCAGCFEPQSTLCTRREAM